MTRCSQSFESSVNCCFGSAFCSLCCSTCPPCKGSTSTRVAFGFFLLVPVLLCCLILIPGLETYLKEIPIFSDQSISNCNENQTDDHVYPNRLGSFAIYRLSFGMAMFFFLFFLIMIKVKTSGEKRAKIQNGFWALKILLALVLIIAAFCIPINRFDQIFSYIGSIGAFFFIMIQMVLSVDFVHSWNELWVDHVESGSRKHGYGLLLSTFFLYAVTISGIILLFLNSHTNKSECLSNSIFLSINTFLCVILSIISILPSVREYNSSCGLLQSSFVSLYVIYFTWSTISNHPNDECRIFVTQCSNLFDPITIIGLILFFCTLLYSIITSSRNSRTKKFFFTPSSADTTILDDAQLVNSVTDNKWLLGSEDHRQQRVYDDERGSVAYNYSLFHLMLCLAILYSMSMLTKWTHPDSSSAHKLSSTPVSMWFKIVSTWFSVILYIWMCVAPAIFPDRDFS